MGYKRSGGSAQGSQEEMLARVHDNYAVVFKNINTFILDMLSDGLEQKLSQKNLAQLLPNFDEPDSRGRYAIRVAVRSDYPGGVRVVKELGGDIDLRGDDGLTPVLLAAKEYKYRAMRTLLSLGVNKYSKDADGLMIIHHLARIGITKQLLLLEKEYGIDLAKADGNDWTALHHAALFGAARTHEKLIDILLLKVGLVVAKEAEVYWDPKNFEHVDELKGSKSLFNALVRSSMKAHRLIPDLIVPLFMAKTVHGKRYLAEVFVCRPDEEVAKKYEFAELDTEWALRMLKGHHANKEAAGS